MVLLACGDAAPVADGGHERDASGRDASGADASGLDAGACDLECGPGRCEAGACVCPLGFAGDRCDACAAGFHRAGDTCIPDVSPSVNYPLEIIQPYPGLDTRNRFYKAYPGLAYDVRAAVIGGAYPFSFALDEAPAGMTVDFSTGEIRWPDPVEAGSPHAVTLAVTDQAGSRETVSWTITVTTDGFRFLDAERGATVADGGDGTLERPWRTLRDMYEGDDYDAKYRDSYRDSFLYFAGGTYATGDAYIEDPSEDGTGRMPLSTSTKPVVWLALPGQRPTLDLAEGAIAIYGGSDNVYVDGFAVTSMTNYLRKGFDLEPGDDMTIRRCAFSNLPTGGIGGSNNQSAIMLSNSGGERGTRMSFQDNRFDAIDAYAIIAYTSDRVLFEDNALDDFEAGVPVIGPKISNSMWFIRRNTLTNMRDVRAIWLNDGGETFDQEVSFNLVIAPAASAVLHVNQESGGATGPVHVFRNTFVGDVSFLRVASADGPFRFYDNVVVSESGEAFGCEECSDPSRIETRDNLAGTPADGIVDAEGRLIGASAALCGTRGHILDCR
jgi:hypothetical protein